jgi:hypothetical protein
MEPTVVITFLPYVMTLLSCVTNAFVLQSLIEQRNPAPEVSLTVMCVLTISSLTSQGQAKILPDLFKSVAQIAYSIVISRGWLRGIFSPVETADRSPPEPPEVSQAETESQPEEPESQ